MTRSNRRLWSYPLFQIPLMCLAACLVAAALFWVLGLGRPSLAVAIALDLSSSTYGSQTFNAPGTVMDREVQAVRSYLQANDQQNKQFWRVPNQVQVFGFGGIAKPLTSGFSADSQQINNELTQALQNPDLPQQIVSNTTNLDAAIQTGTTALAAARDRCRELLLVTDGEAPVNPNSIASAIQQKVRLNSIIVGAEAPALRAASFATNGLYLSGQSDNLEALFIERFFVRINTNIKWVIFWLGASWIALMWLLVLPLDRWIFQGLMGASMDLAGRLSLANALFWSTLTPIVVWQILRLLDLPFFSAC